MEEDNPVKLILSWSLFQAFGWFEFRRNRITLIVSFSLTHYFFIIIKDWINNRNNVIENIEVRLCLYRIVINIFLKLRSKVWKSKNFFFCCKSKVSFLYFHYSVSYQIYLNISNKRYIENNKSERDCRIVWIKQIELKWEMIGEKIRSSTIWNWWPWYDP